MSAASPRDHLPDADFAAIIGDVAKRLYAGKPCKQNGTGLRFGNKGSLSVQTAGLGKGVWRCHESGRGGGTLDLVMHTLACDRGGALTWLQAQGFIAARDRPAAEPTFYDYRDETGTLLFQAVRLAQPRADGSRFYQRRPDGEGGWLTKLGDVRRVLYRLPELCAADPTAVVWLAEGERDANNLRRLGLVATTAPMGAGNWRDEYTAMLADRDVVVLPDNDPPGEAHAEKVAASLAGTARSVRVLRLPNLPAKGDISDWLDSGHDVAELRALADAVPVWGNAQDTEPKTAADEYADAAIGRLARLKSLQYERVRVTEANRLGVRVGFLDRMVRAERPGNDSDTAMQGRPVEFPAPEPWPEPVDGAALLADLTGYFARHLFAPQRVPATLALWTLHTFCFDLFRVTPRLQLKSVTRRSGKTTTLELLQSVVAKPVRTENISVAALFRVVEIAAPTLLIDEIDRFLARDDELIGMLNAGAARGGQALRCVGDNAEVRQFSVFAPAVLAGIGNLPDTLADRSIRVTMKRATRGEQPTPITSATEAEAARLGRQAVRWVADHHARLAEADPDMGNLFARAASTWRPLYAIADAAGDNWPDLVRKASEALATDDDDAETLGVKLLADLRVVFATDGRAEIPTGKLVAALLDMADRPWPEMPPKGRELTTSRLTRLLKPFGIKRQRGYDETTQKMGDWGYRQADFADAFGRYLDA